MTPADVLDAPLPFAFTWKGRELLLQVPARTFGVEVELQRALERRVYLRLQVHREEMGPDDYRATLSAWLDRCGAGAYEFGGRLMWEWLQTRSGWAENAFLTLKAGPSAGLVTRGLLDAVLADDGKWRELDQLLARASSPNRKTPAPVIEAPALAAAAAG
jgi:hypothetical protein